MFSKSVSVRDLYIGGVGVRSKIDNVQDSVHVLRMGGVGSKIVRRRLIYLKILLLASCNDERHLHPLICKLFITVLQ